jgi:mitochondrial fission protein ELM1
MSENEPNVWCLLGRKAGDNTQVRSLAEALGWSFTEKRILARSWELLPHLLLRETLAGIDVAGSSDLASPWPDVVITAGRRNEPVARWIRKQSGRRAKLVHIGRPWASLDSWDLVITTPQYFLPVQPNIRHNQLPLHRMPAEQLAAAGDKWRRSLGHMPRPWVAVLVGGDSGKFVFTAEKGKRLGEWAQGLADRTGGSLLVAGSPRTPVPILDALLHEIEVPHFGYRWAEGDDNPYLGFLALADAFVVSGESMSMLGEASATGKPLYIFDMGDGDRQWWRLWHNFQYKPLSHRLAMVLGPTRMRRDVGRIQDALVASGQARWLGPDSAFVEQVAAVAPQCERELEESAAAVRRLLAQR